MIAIVAPAVFSQLLVSAPIMIPVGVLNPNTVASNRCRLNAMDEVTEVDPRAYLFSSSFQAQGIRWSENYVWDDNYVSISVHTAVSFIRLAITCSVMLSSFLEKVAWCARTHARTHAFIHYYIYIDVPGETLVRDECYEDRHHFFVSGNNSNLVPS